MQTEEGTGGEEVERVSVDKTACALGQAMSREEAHLITKLVSFS